MRRQVWRHFLGRTYMCGLARVGLAKSDTLHHKQVPPYMTPPADPYVGALDHGQGVSPSPR